MFHGRTAAEIRVTPPDDRDATGKPGLTLARLAWCFEQTRGPIVFSHFGAQAPVLWDGITKHLDAGRRVLGCLDYTQFKGPSEQKIVKPFIESHPKPWQDQDIVVGHSMYRSSILHQKTTVFNAPLDGYAPTIGDYETVEEAFAAGAAVSWFGSFNISSNAGLQSNTVAILPGIVVAQMLVDDICQMRDYIIQSQQRYQPFPRNA